MESEIEAVEEMQSKGGIRGVHVLWIVLATVLITAAITFWFVRS
jgi:hypothetical protein